MTICSPYPSFYANSVLFFVVVARVAIKPSTEFISYELLIRLMRGNCRRRCNTIYTRKATCKHSVSPCLVMQFCATMKLLMNALLFLQIYSAFVSWVRFYSAFPKDMRAIFNRKQVHMGHYAKSLGLREPPSSFSHKFSAPRPERPSNRLTYAHKE